MEKDYQEVLSKLKRGERAVIRGFCTDDVPIKLFEMGILPGVELELVFAAPFYDPLCISYGKGRYCLALRKDEAENVFVQRLP